MDRAITPKKWTTRKVLLTGGLPLLGLLAVGGYYYGAGPSQLNVDPARVTVSEVRQGSFQEFIPVSGVVLPETTIYLDALEGGRVEEKYVEDGALMKKGQPVLRLSNADLELSLVNQETAVLNLFTQMQMSRNAAQQNTNARLNQLADADNAYQEAERVFKLQKTLYEQKVIALQDYKQAENAYHYQTRRRRLSRTMLHQDSSATRQETTQAARSYARMQNALTLMRRKVGDLIVRAPIDGQLTSLDAEIGQNINKGARLGQLDAATGHKVRADIDEHYITRIFPGLRGTCTVSGREYPLQIRKVYTQVAQGRFQVDMVFPEAVPKAIRRGQTLQIRLTLGDETRALLLAKGGFYQQTGGAWVYKLTPDGRRAYRADVRLGRQNPDYYEVLGGLQPGDRVITSGYDTYGTMQELVLGK
ncbi:HlyD family efflux transporter periplasmic adaptor subunit [Hymenobacter sp. 15J16-1T3B]|uniref:efflux RND transporter periplasmic adaptor subunit n=1 Tax=Hymenobacter sp. 15J16-1T3B TaxID=2886941 RepID=UPI001D12564F|nr:HlyD family efflux transporter periplasmic adaptor subunit [Hymenobacter sp. 15J16-1T3B]MCC3160015.1 HlyD family efflux transporter periplasmic adaptor subunit [Hymenobacter sp. 15J16-1T3B]